MTFWLDAHLNEDLAAWLGSRFGVIARHVREIGLRDADDSAILSVAKHLGHIVVVTKDSDLAEEIHRVGGQVQVVWLHCGNLANLELQALLARCFAQVLERLRAGAILVEVHLDGTTS